MSRAFAPAALLFGNFAIGTAIIGPAGMLNELARGLSVDVHVASYLITAGAAVLCFGSPFVSGWTSRMDRRTLLAGSLAIIAAAQIASAFANSFAVVFALRMVMLVAAAPFTPQAAGVVGLLVPVERRSSGIAFVFLGWSIAAAAGVPLAGAIATRWGWQFSFAAMGTLAGLSAAFLAWRLPRGLHLPPVDLKEWGILFRNPMVLLLLAVTMLQMSGQFLVMTFIAPLLLHFASATPDTISLAFALYGVTGFAGNVMVQNVVERWGSFATSLFFLLCVFTGISCWSFGAGVLAAMLVGVGIWGFGFAAANSMQQARLVAAAPTLAGAAVALNTSSLYVGQAVGSGIGGVLFAHEQFRAIGFTAMGFMIVALCVVMFTRPRSTPAAA